jgi:sulfonate transport system permease protein
MTTATTGSTAAGRDGGSPGSASAGGAGVGDAVAVAVTDVPSTQVTATPGDRAVGRRNRGRNLLLALWLPVVLLVGWWFLSANSTSPYFPPLQVILQSVWDEWVIGDAKTQLWPSLRHLALGFIGGSLLGVLGGALLWRLPVLRKGTNPIVYFLYVLPAPALLPAMIALFGLGEARQVALIAFGATWPALLNTLDGMRGIDQVKFDTARAMKFSSLRTVTAVVLPGASPQIAAGLRASLQVSIILMVVSEMIAASEGIGYFILYAQTVFAIVTMWSGIVVLSVLGTLLNYLFVFAEHRLLGWYHGSRAVGTDKA